MPKDYTGEIVNKILTPEDPGFNNPNLPWGGIRNVVGWKKPEAIQIHISGFYLIDRRMTPWVAIFKNLFLVGDSRPPSGEDPIPFESLDEALYRKKQMNLSLDDAKKVKPVALSPDPGLGNAKPNVMWVRPKTAKVM